MNKIVEYILGASALPADQRQVAARLSKNEEALVRNAHDADTALEALDPSIHTVGYAYILTGKMKQVNSDNIGVFRLQVQPQLCCTDVCQASRLLEVVYIAKSLTNHTPSDLCIRPLSRAIIHMQNGRKELLTPIHALFLRVCLLSRMYKRALTALGSEIIDIDPNTTSIDVQSILEYFYYGGMVFTGLKRYTDACHYYEMCVTAPATSLSAIALAAFRKFILVSLLCSYNHKDVLKSKSLSQAVSRGLKTLAEPYLNIAAMFGFFDPQAFAECIESNREVLERDRNLGLAAQCVDRLRRVRIQRLTLTFVTLSLDDIAKQVLLPSAAEAERQILSMIEAGEITATISQLDGTVSFHEESGAPVTVDKMEADIEHFMELQKKLEDTRKQLELSQEYLVKMLKQKRGGDRGEASGFIEYDDDPMMAHMMMVDEM